MAILAGVDAPLELLFDVCITGAGASGLALGSDFASRHHSVGILESGEAGAMPSLATAGIVAEAGLPYAALSTSRLSGFGGSTQAYGWGGLCKPLDPLDFETRSWVRESGWPVDAGEIGKFYQRAAVTLGVSEPSGHATPRLLYPGLSSVLSLDSLELARYARMGDALREAIDRSRSVKVFTRLTLLHLEFAEDGGHVSGAVCVDASGRRLRIISNYFVLAAGGIENARLLLVSNRIANRPPGLAGQFFMDHPRVTLGTLRPSGSAVRSVLAGLDRIRVARRHRMDRWFGIPTARKRVVTGLTLSPQVQRDEGLLNHRAWIEPVFPGQTLKALEALKRSLLEYRDRVIGGAQARDMTQLLKGNMNWTTAMHLVRPQMLASRFRLHHFLEPEPFGDSRVSLSSQRDRHDMPLVRLEWRLSTGTLDSFRRTVALLQAEFARVGLATLDVEADEWQQLEQPMWTWHHMGTTRMSLDERRGVVDSNCRVHGVDNLFIAGSSVFPTAGNDTPTFTIVALAHRLSDYLLTLLP